MSTPHVPPERSDLMEEEIRRLMRRQSQALRAGNAALSSLLSAACERLAGELSSCRDAGLPALPGHEPLSKRPGLRETQADFGDFAR